MQGKPPNGRVQKHLAPESKVWKKKKTNPINHYIAIHVSSLFITDIGGGACHAKSCQGSSVQRAAALSLAIPQHKARVNGLTSILNSILQKNAKET